MKNRLGKLVWYDLRYGFRDCRLKWLWTVLMQLYLVNAACQSCWAAEENAGVLGYLTWLFRGMPEYFAAETGRFELPVPWLLLHGGLLFLVGFYPFYDLTRSGGQAFIRSGRRRYWLFAKAAWIVCTVTAYYICLTLLLVFFACITGGMSSSSEVMSFLYGVSVEKMGGADIFLAWWAEPFLVSLGLCLTEMVLSLVLEPAPALFFMLVYLTASVFWTSPWLLGNYAMLMRQDFWSGKESISFTNCLAGCAAWSVAVLGAGSRMLRKKDIFLWEA